MSTRPEQRRAEGVSARDHHKPVLAETPRAARCSSELRWVQEGTSRYGRGDGMEMADARRAKRVAAQWEEKGMHDCEESRETSRGEMALGSLTHI